VLKQQLRHLRAAMDDLLQNPEVESNDGMSDAGSDCDDSRDQNASPASLQHVRLYRELQANWQAYDAYARVSMALGANQLLQATGYYLIGLLVCHEESYENGLACVAACSMCAWLLSRLDLYLSWRRLFLAGVLIALPGPVAVLAIATQGFLSNMLSNMLTALVFVLHIAWLLFMLQVAAPGQFGALALPANFRSVLYLDVFGHIPDPSQGQPGQEGRAGTGNANSSDANALSVVLEEPEFRLASLDSAESFVRQHSAGSFTRQHSNPLNSFHLPQQPTRVEFRASLVDCCRSQCSDVDSDLRHLEAVDLPPLVGEEGFECGKLRALRAKFNETFKRLQAIAPEAAGGLGPQPSSQAHPWLTVELNSSGQASVYYVSCETQEITWNRPAAPNRILELSELHGRLKKIRSYVEGLSQLQQDACDDSDGPPMPSDSTRETASYGLPPQNVSTESVPYPEPTQNVSTESVPDPQVPSQDQTDEGPAQETRFGGTEAISEEAIRDPAAFHPHRNPPMGGGSGGSRDTRRPGQLPWRTVHDGSWTLVIVWCLGLLWHIVAGFFSSDIHLTPRPAPNNTRMGIVELVGHWSWDDLPEAPRALACHETIAHPGVRLLAAQKYAVRELYLGNHGNALESTSALALADCLAAHPDVVAAGFRSIALECSSTAASSGHNCSAMLLTVDGGTAIRCHVVFAKNGQQPLQASLEERLLIHGGRWEALLSSSRNSSNREGLLWAQHGSRGSLTILSRRLGASQELVPQMETLHQAAERSVQLHVHEGSGMMLGLESAGQLSAWSLADGSSGPLWTQQLMAGTEWLGMCAAGRSAYILGTPAGKEHVGVSVWRVRLPHWLLNDGSVASQGSQQQAESSGPRQRT